MTVARPITAQDDLLADRSHGTGLTRFDARCARTRSRGTVWFSPPLCGPSGSSLVSYTWQWEPFYYIDNYGEERVRRVSDWDKAETNAATGRDIVHQFAVRDSNGVTQVVSAETAARLLGWAQQAAEFTSAASRAKSLARLHMQRHEVAMLWEAWEADYAQVAALPVPALPDEPIVTSRSFARYEWQMGDVVVWDSVPGPIREERRSVLIDEWRRRRMDDRGWRSHNGTSLRHRLADLDRRLQRAARRAGMTVAAEETHTGVQGTGLLTGAAR
jgi:hypothetical protein